MKPTLSLIVTVFRSESNLPGLLQALGAFAAEHAAAFRLECVFVVDGSPDRSFEMLTESLPRYEGFCSQVHLLSRNFGAPYALRCGLMNATGDYFSSIAADQQEPFEAVFRAFKEVHHEHHDICFGQRVARDDPFFSKLLASVYWFFYRRFVQPEIPPGGVDFFVCNRRVCEELLRLSEQNRFIAGLLFWLGFDRAVIPYRREKRLIGTSSWTFRKKLGYLMDSIFVFSDLPIKLLIAGGIVGLLISVGLASSIVYARLTHSITVPGYAATVTVICFFGGLNSFGLGILGEYVWRVFENSKARPHSITRVSQHFHYDGVPASGEIRPA